MLPSYKESFMAQKEYSDDLFAFCSRVKTDRERHKNAVMTPFNRISASILKQELPWGAFLAEGVPSSLFYGTFWFLFRQKTKNVRSTRVSR